MKKEQTIALFYVLFLLAGDLFAVGEKVFSIGAASTWQAAETRQGITEIPAVRPYPVLVLSSTRSEEGHSRGFPPDMALSFDEGGAALFADQTGHYRVLVSEAAVAAGTLSVVDRPLARAGAGAVFFSNPGISPFPAELLPASSGSGVPAPLTLLPRGEALLAPGRLIRDFSIEFWIYPLNTENGEEILSWAALREFPERNYILQRIQCGVSKNRLQWTFTDFFSLPGENRRSVLTLGSLSPVLPQVWSHHLIRFDSGTGLLEYLVNGRLEALVYATSSGREGGEIYTPLAGDDGSLILGGRFTGMLDELRIYDSFLEDAPLDKYPARGGRMETRLLDLGEGQNVILKVDALGGRVSRGGRFAPGGELGGALNEYTENGSFRFPDESALQIFIRTMDTLWRPPGEWQPLVPGREITGGLRGRFVQLAAVFYPSGDGETTPYLEELRILYQPDPPPLPPTQFTAVPRDGGVDLSWKGSPDADLTGYLVYYGLSGGEYFGDHAILGVSPIDVGKRTSVRIDGLRNGILYYFVVAAYDRVNPHRPGTFSRELTARPLRMIE
jgi:hypothetical protein